MKMSEVMGIVRVLAILWVGVLLVCLIYGIATALFRWMSGEESIALYMIGLAMTSLAIGTYLYWLYGAVWFALLLISLQLRAPLLDLVGFRVVVVSGMAWPIAHLGIASFIDFYSDMRGGNILSGFIAAIASTSILMFVCVRKRSKA